MESLFFALKESRRKIPSPFAAVLSISEFHMNVVTLQQLESHLWEADWLLKGPIDAADFKTYIFPMLFFKDSRL